MLTSAFSSKYSSVSVHPLTSEDILVTDYRLLGILQGHYLQDYNWIPSSGGNLQEEKPLNTGAETEAALGHSCVCSGLCYVR